MPSQAHLYVVGCILHNAQVELQKQCWQPKVSRPEATKLICSKLNSATIYKDRRKPTCVVGQAPHNAQVQLQPLLIAIALSQGPQAPELISRWMPLPKQGVQPLQAVDADDLPYPFCNLPRQAQLAELLVDLQQERA